MAESMTYEERLQEHVRAVADVVNHLSPRSCSDFAALFTYEHRSLQQSLTRLAVAWLVELAKPETRFDLRNEASVKLAREFVAKVPERGLPFI